MILKSLLIVATPHMKWRLSPETHSHHTFLGVCLCWGTSFKCMCDMTHLHMWRDWFACVTCRIRMCAMTCSHVIHELFAFVTWLCDMTHLHVLHDAFACITRLIRICYFTHSNVIQPSFARVAWLISWDLTHSCVWRGSFVSVTRLAYEWVVPQVQMSHASHSNELNNIFEWVT